MTLPVSSYEELLVQVRGLTHETILLQRQLSSDLFDDANGTDCDLNHNLTLIRKNYENGKLLANSCDAVLRQRDNNRRFEVAQNQNTSRSLVNKVAPIKLAASPPGSFQSGELTARLIAWQNLQSSQSTEGRATATAEEERNAKEPEDDEKDAEAEDSSVVSGSEKTHLRTSLGGVGTPESPERTALSIARPSDAPSTTHPTVATPQSPQSQRRTQTRCTRANIARSPRTDNASLKVNKEDVMEPELKEKDEHKSSSPSPEFLSGRGKTYNEDGSSEDDNSPSTCSRSHRLSSLYHGTWPVERGLWNGQQTGLVNQQSTSTNVHNDIASVMSFSSSMSMGVGCPGGVQGVQGQRRLGAKVDVVYSLLGMLGGAEGREDMSATLLSMSSSTDSCLAMRQSGCLPLLVQLIHAPGQDPETRERASQAIHNIVHSRGEERAGRREARVLRLLEQLRDYCQTLRTTLEAGQPIDDFDRHPGPTIAALMKLSFDEAHRHAMCQLGGLHAVAELIEMDHAAHGSECDDQNCVTLRRYAGMALTNLTFGDGNNKALLCSFREFMKALVAQLRSPSDDLRQVTASVLRNLSWRADSSSKQTLREVGAVIGLTLAAMEGRKESTLKSILSALWNLSAHCSTNKIDICAVEGSLAFLVDMLSYKAPSKTLAIVENAGGILRNVSSHVAVREDYRSVLRERGCLQVLLRQLRSPSLTVVSNACGALWNLSARCSQDQRMLWDLGAVPMLRSLVHSKHKMISMGSSAALKNLLGARPGSSNLVHLDSTARGLGLPTLPTLVARRQRALEQEIDQNLAETCDNIEPSTSPTNKDDKFGFKAERRFAESDFRSGHSFQMQSSQPGPSTMRFNSVARSESRESIRSITSTHSDTIFEKVNRHVLNGVSPTESQVKQQSSSLHAATGFNAGISNESAAKGANSDRKYVLRYKNAIPERQRPSNDLPFNDVNDIRCTTSTISWASAADQEATCSQILMHSSIEETSSSSELSKPSVSRKDNIKSQVLFKDCESSSITSFTARSAGSSSSTSLPRYNRSALSEEVTSQHQDSLHNASSKNGEITGAIKREIPIPKPIDYRLKYTACGMDSEDEKQHSGYFAESEEEYSQNNNLKNQYADKSQHKTRSSKVCRDFNGKDEPNKSRKYSSEKSLYHLVDKRGNRGKDDVSNSSSSISSLTITATDRSAACISDTSTIQTASHEIEESNNVSKVEATNDICTLNRVSENEISHDLTERHEEQTIPAFPQFDSLGLLSGFDQQSGDYSSLPSNSSQQFQSLASTSELLDSSMERASSGFHSGSADEAQDQTSILPLTQRLSYPGPFSVKYNTFMSAEAPTSLTIDHEPKIANDSRLKECSTFSAASFSDSEGTGEPLNLNIESIVEDMEEDNDPNDSNALPAACLASEMQTNRPFRRSSLQKAPQPISNLARYQTSSALNQVDMAPPVNSTTEIPSFRQSTYDVNNTISGNMEDNPGEVSRPYSLICMTQHEPDMDSSDTYVLDMYTGGPNSSQNLSSVLDDVEGHFDTTNLPTFLPVSENTEINLHAKNNSGTQQTALGDEPVYSEEKMPASRIVSEITYPAPLSSDPLISRESVPALEEENVLDDQSSLTPYDVNDMRNQEQYVDLAKVAVPLSLAMEKDIENEDEATINRTMFDFSLGLESCTDGNSSEEKDASKSETLSPEVLENKIDDDTENINISEEENFSDAAMSPTIDPLFSAVERAVNKVDRSKNREESEEEYRRQRDPDAMIASLDRLTATLVQQTEAMRERESSAMKQSVVSDTWNEDSPNDVSFPSISVSAPLIASFKSDNQEDQMITMPEYPEEMIGIQELMTDSRIIEREANKLADAVNARVAEFDFETMSMTSLDLDAIRPPSTMGSLASLTTSLIGSVENNENTLLRERCNSTSLPPLQFKSQTAESRYGRKKSLPAGVVAKRALSQYQTHTGSLENLMNETSTASVSHLENVKPPSMMDELLDAMDMENSMLSVASITSEVADSKDQDSHSLTASDPVFDLLKPVANILSMTCMRYAESMQVSGNNSLSECLENINPPSLFNEVSEMDESTMEPNSDTLCSDTLCIDQELHTEEVSPGRGTSIERIEECDNDTDDAATSIPSEYCVSSSAESTPKKKHHKNHLTPKQKRQLAKERYKTYTIAAEMVKKEEEERRKHDHEESRIGKYAGGKCSPFSKLTPKQRRQEDRARFQTQVLNNPFPILGTYTAPETKTPLPCTTENPEIDEAASIIKSGIPKFSKLSGGKTVKQKRAENKDRYRTRTLDDEEAQEAVKDVDIVRSSSQFEDSDASIETLLHVSSGEMDTVPVKRANAVSNILGQTNSHGEPCGEDVFIDCETLSLVSNDSEAEHCLRSRFTNGLAKRPINTQYSNLRLTEEKPISPSKDLPPELDSVHQQDIQHDSDSESNEESNSANEQSQIPKRPRIVKPGTMSRDASIDSNATDKSEPESPKTIRGRRKALYSNPTTRKTTPQTSPSKVVNGAASGIPIGRSNTSPLVRGTRATTLRQTHNPSFPTKSPQKSMTNSKLVSSGSGAVEKRARASAQIANRTSIPQKGTVFNYAKSTKRHTMPSGSSSSHAVKEEKKEPTFKPLERQGTFTKEEPEVENAPTVLPPCSPSKSKIAKPVKTSPSKLQTPTGKLKPVTKSFQTSQSKFANTPNLEKDQAKSTSPMVTQQRRSLIGSPIKHSPSNQSLQSNESGRIAKKPNALGQRSNSNSSIVSNSSGGVQGRRTTKDATSKIASLWKRVEESKTKQRFEKNDTRHWITPASGAVEASSPVVTTKPPTFRLIRSSTFEGVPKDISRTGTPGKPKSNMGKRQSKVSDTPDIGTKYRNSCDLSGMSIAEAPCKIPLKYPDSKVGKRDSIQIGDSTVILRRQQTTGISADPEVDPTKRVSRLGSFIRVDPPDADSSNVQTHANHNLVRTPASAIVLPFNYNPKQTSPVKSTVNEIDGKLEMTECQMEITTSSMRVTTV